MCPLTYRSRNTLSTNLCDTSEGILRDSAALFGETYGYVEAQDEAHDHAHFASQVDLPLAAEEGPDLAADVCRTCCDYDHETQEAGRGRDVHVNTGRVQTSKR